MLYNAVGVAQVTGVTLIFRLKLLAFRCRTVDDLINDRQLYEKGLSKALLSPYLIFLN